jgi:ankyrin repeat protein
MPAAQYPMHVLPVARLLQLQRLPTHEEIKDELVLQRDGMVTVFVSQTWLSRSHPDTADNVKLTLLRSFLRDASAGKKDVRPSLLCEIFWGGRLKIPARALRKIQYVWLDVFSIPQADTARQGEAIASIPNYVERAAFFVCVAGPWKHESGALRDVRAWCARGWCRMELLCNLLSPEAKPLILIQSPSDVRSHGPAGLFGRNWIISPVGRGEFTVEADRVALGPVIERLIDERMVAKRAEGTDLRGNRSYSTGTPSTTRAGTEAALRWYRFLHAHKASLLLGTGINVTPHDTLESWLGQLGFGSATQRDRNGWSPLSYAVLEGRADLVTALLDAGANATGALRRDDPAFLVVKGMSNLHLAAMRCDEDDTVESIIKVLLACGADAGQNDTSGNSCLHFACTLGRISCIEAILKHLPALKDAPMAFGVAPFGYLALNGHTAALERYMDSYPDDFKDDNTGAPAGWVNYACELVGDLELIAALIKRGHAVDYFDATKAVPKLKKILWVSKLVNRLMNRPPTILDHYAVGYATPLHLAAYNGNIGAVELLLGAGADIASTRHPLAMTPLHAAAAAGHREVCARLLAAGAPVDARDGRGRTPSAWARLRGHADLAREVARDPSRVYCEE